ncbi:MAG: site-specific integrase [Prevotellaceae bacterium]|jgi:site-specific recombinase XerD|nr:site-specific integrase [Prevotellaceae bacterium]
MQKNRSTFSTLFYLNTSKTKKSGKCPVMGRISVDGKNTAFSTGIDILPEQWDAKEGLATGKSKEVDNINRQIENYRTEIAGHYKTLLDTKGYVTAESLKNALRGIGGKQTTLMQEFTALVEEKRQAIGILIEATTQIRYVHAYRNLKIFLQEKYGVTDILFGQVDFAFLEAYIYYLKVNRQYMPKTVNQNIKPLRKVVKRAFNKGLVYQDPFFDYKPERFNIKRRWLSMDEIEKIMQVQMKRATANFVRDMFLFSTFTGIAHVDMVNLRHDNIHRQDDGSLWITLNRQKTGTASYIPMLDIPIKIMEKYRNTEFAGRDGKIFKMTTIENMDVQLKKIAKAAGIKQPLSYHMSRHSFASSVCLSQGVPIETISQMMGHRDISTTQIYAEITRTKINEDMTNLEKQIEGKYVLAER